MLLEIIWRMVSGGGFWGCLGDVFRGYIFGGGGGLTGISWGVLETSALRRSFGSSSTNGFEGCVIKDLILRFWIS